MKFPIKDFFSKCDQIKLETEIENTPGQCAIYRALSF